ncbi:hypothetical protein, partial [uncultured Bacteroides sp.]|uniref:hypothetical protein n=1 Tax=uncultured Bacteroides sp. TaxID=162156 RepID=UPI00259A72F7
CFQWFKDTKMKANHNSNPFFSQLARGCFQWFKDTKMKANHNRARGGGKGAEAVSNGSKILK